MKLSHNVRLIRCRSTTAPQRAMQLVIPGELLALMEAAIEFYGLCATDVEDFNRSIGVSRGDWCVLDITDVASQDIPDVAAWTLSSIAQRATVVLLGLQHDCVAHADLLRAVAPDPGICMRMQSGDGHRYYVPSRTSHITALLAGACIPWSWPTESPPSYFDTSSAVESGWLPLIAGLDDRDSACPYVLISDSKESASSSPAGGLVLVADTPFTRTSDIDPDRVCPAVLTALLLVRLAAQERCWHRNEVMANFTIDDPNLVEPYGRISYNALLRSMRAAGYHTTIAFIPWNHRRTERDMETLFAEEPQYLSLAVHGNDHDGYEFAAAPAQLGDTTPTRRISRQRASVAEALVRMKMLAHRTGLSFSPVMIFPHGIGSVDAIRQLERSGYLASANRQLVPSGAGRPPRFDFGLRPADDTYASFPLMQRWWPTDVVPELAAFLGKPILLYGHERDFASPLAALEEHVARIRHLNPEWCDLTGIARSLYLERDTGAGETQVWMLSGEIDIVNRGSENREFTFLRDNVDADSYDVSINGAPSKPEQQQNRIAVRATGAPGQRIQVRIVRRKSVASCTDDGAVVGPRSAAVHDRLRVALRRRVCDWRDRYLPRLGAMAPEGAAFAPRTSECEL